MKWIVRLFLKRILTIIKMTNTLLHRLFEIVRCKLCGSRGTHRKCSNLRHYDTDWVCADCKAAVEENSKLSKLLFNICLFCRIIPKLHTSPFVNCLLCLFVCFLPESVQLPNHVESPLAIRQERKRLFKNISDFHSSLITKRYLPNQ